MQVGLGELLQRGLDLRDQLHLLAVEGRLLGVALAVVRREVLGRELLAQRQQGVVRLAVVLGEARRARLSFSTSSHSKSMNSRSRAERIVEGGGHVQTLLPLPPPHDERPLRSGRKGRSRLPVTLRDQAP